jgi:hypothetical protein
MEIIQYVIFWTLFGGWMIAGLVAFLLVPWSRGPWYTLPLAFAATYGYRSS